MTDVAGPPVHHEAATRRDRAATAAVLGVAGALWLTWGSQALPGSWRTPVAVVAYLGLFLGVMAGMLAWRRRSSGSAMADAAGRARYRKTVLVEAAAIVAGVVALVLTGQAAYLPAWVLLVVGVHFVPLARLFRVPELTVCGVLLVLVAAAAIGTGITGAARPVVIAGGIGGVVMIIFCLACLSRGN